MFVSELVNLVFKIACYAIFTILCILIFNADTWAIGVVILIFVLKVFFDIVKYLKNKPKES